MIRLSDISLPPEHSAHQLPFEAARMLRIPNSKIRGVRIVRRSVDARKKPDVRIIYTIDVTVEVNGGEYASFQATSGQTYKVGVLDLPTGTGSIVITSKSGPIACHLLGDESDYSISCSTRNRRCNTNGNFGNGPKKVILNSDHGEVSYSFQNGFDGGRPSNRYNRKDSFKEW